MDYADEDAVTRYERWERALLALEWLGGSASDPTGAIARWALMFHGTSSIITMKREALINAARIEGDEHLVRIGKAFPGVDLPALVQALRIKFVEMRMAGDV